MSALPQRQPQTPALPANRNERAVIPVRTLPVIISEFQPDAVELEERAPPRIARLALYGVTLLIVAAVAWASLASIDEIVVAPGRLITKQPTIIVQPLETSIIRSIDVAAGDVVRAGQTLATLDPTFSQSDVDQQRAKFIALDAQVKRIDAELAGADYSKMAGSAPDEQLQVELFGQRRAFLMAQLQNFDQQIAGQESTITTAKGQEVVLKERLDNLVEIERAREKLYEQDFGSRLNLLSSRDARLSVDASLAQLQGGAVAAEHTLAKLRADRQAFIEDFRRTSMERLVELRSQLSTVGEELKKMELRRTMVSLTAPADAVVLDLAARSIGSVVREAERIITLVPLNVPLEAEVSVNARDIGRVKADDEVRIKFDAYPFQKFGTATGAIRTISRDAFTPDPQSGTTQTAALPFFRALIPVSGMQLDAPLQPVRLLPGMTVTAEIKVGRRTVISYFLYPLIRGLDESIREP
ncbi:HlyD family type I secretion periplasmic adaptor subunit [Aminobacter sp. AP02]|uniref:HlyD family type I secretion periplasmic adaptor subunit n=1 Tax=Aminobacter sp. AP02 TaxID=2135737 RepID=UPI000D6CEAED|nr:HlyD family type I secretion periplasmic adaptor subunit [Aminobacter sp. AP02]PWK76981.1 HlyD family secretion protein [Aminobacter sp. AP02]